MEPPETIPKLDSNSVTNRKLEEYSTQFLNFTPRSFVDGCYNALHDYTVDAFSCLEKFIESDPSSVITVEQARNATEVIFPIMSKAYGRAFDKLEGYLLSNIFHIPNNVVLPEDRVQEERPTAREEDQAADNEIAQLRDKIKNAKFRQACLRQELKDTDRVRKMIDERIEYFTSLEKTCGKEGVSLSMLADSIIFNSDKSKKVLHVLKDLEPLPPVKKRSSVGGEGEPSQKRQCNKE